VDVISLPGKLHEITIPLSQNITENAFQSGQHFTREALVPVFNHKHNMILKPECRVVLGSEAFTHGCT
jgi:hypothetical protein